MNRRSPILCTVLVIACCGDGPVETHPDSTLSVDSGIPAGDSALADGNAPTDSGTPADRGSPEDSAAADDTATSAADGEADQQAAVDSVQSRCPAHVNLAPLNLHSAYCVVARVTAPSAAAFALRGDAVWTFAQPIGQPDSPVSFVVRTYPLDTVAMTLGAPLSAFGFNVQPDAGVLVFGSSYLALSPNETAAAGFTRTDGFRGAIFQAKAEDMPTGLDAKGNFDAIWLDDDTLLVNGLALGTADAGPGVYVWRRGNASTPRLLIESLGQASGFLALGSTVVYAGGSAWPANNVYAFTRAEIDAAIGSGNGPLSGTSDGDLVYSGPLTDAGALGDDLVVLDTSFDVSFNAVFNGLRRVAVTIDGAEVRKGDTTDIVTPGSGTARPTMLASSGDRLGMLVDLGDDGTDLVIVTQE